MMTSDAILAEIARLDLAERMNLLEKAWDTLCRPEQSVEIPEWHKEALDQRLAEHNTQPAGEELPAQVFHAKLKKVFLKQQTEMLISELPEETSWDDLMDSIYLQTKIENGLRDMKEGRTYTTEALERMFNIAQHTTDMV